MNQRIGKVLNQSSLRLISLRSTSAALRRSACTATAAAGNHQRSFQWARERLLSAQGILFAIKRSISSANGNATAEHGTEKHVVYVSDGTALAVRVRFGEGGKDSPLLMCFPGALGTWRDFEYQFSSSKLRRFTIVSFDPRGYGESRSTGVQQRDFPINFYERDADDAVTVLQELFPRLGRGAHMDNHGFSDRPVCFMGWSDGANTACIAAAKYPHLAQSLVIFGGNSYVTEEDLEQWEQTRDISHWSERMRSSLTAIYGDELQSLWNRYCDGIIDLYKQRAGDVCLSELHQIRCPTLLLHGEKDPMTSNVHPQYIKQQLHNVTYFEFVGGKHNIHMRFADRFNEMLSNFIDTNTANTEEHYLQQFNEGLISTGTYEVRPAAAANINDIAYGFMGSKALFEALHLGIFDVIEGELSDNGDNEGFASFDAIADKCGRDCNNLHALRTLLTALSALGLLDQNTKGWYRNTSSTSMELVSTSRYYWGDYLKYQIDMQFYPRMGSLGSAYRPSAFLKGNSSSSESVEDYSEWFKKDPHAAQLYTQAQHNGSLATARVMIRRLDCFQKHSNGTTGSQFRLLDIGGGSGAFAIALCTSKGHENSHATVLDLPAVINTARNIIATASENAPMQRLEERIQLLDLSATDPDWHLERAFTARTDDNNSLNLYDVALMSYVSGSLPHNMLPEVYGKAFSALRPGGKLIVHDFMVHNSRAKGPTNAALWALAHVTVNPDGIGLTPQTVIELTTDAGFCAPHVQDLIPGMTKVVVLTKPSLR